MAASNAVILISMIMVVIMCMAAHSHAQDLTCQTVVDDLLPCKTYLQQGGDLPAQCCDGVSSLNSAANTAADRKTACECLKAIAKTYQVNPQYASSLPSSCNVDIPYPISYNTDCDTVQ